MRYAGRKTILHITAFLGLVGIAVGQPVQAPSEVGLPFSLTHYTATDYGAHPENWEIDQDRRGVIYVANKSGVLEYDGVTWRLIPVAQSGERGVYSLAVDTTNVVFAGAIGTFGYLEPGATGTQHYVPLLDHVDPAARGFSRIHGTHATADGVYFVSDERIFRWDGADMRTWDPDGSRFHTSFLVRDRLYVREDSIGLKEMVDGELRLLPGGEQFAQLRVFVMVPLSGGRTLIVAQQSLFDEPATFYIYDGAAIRPFEMAAGSQLDGFGFYHGCALPGGYIALATVAGGVVIVDEQGRLVHVLDEVFEVTDPAANYVFADAQGGLWMALYNKGIIRTEVPFQLSVFDERLGLQGNINDLIRYRGTLYAATSVGLYTMEQGPMNPFPGRGQTNKERAYMALTHDVTAWALTPYRNELLVGTDNGIYRVTPTGDVVPLTFQDDEIRNVKELQVSNRYPGVVYVGTQSGLMLMQSTADGWILYRNFGGIEDEVFSMMEAADGTLWVSTSGSGTAVWRLLFPDSPPRPPRSERYTVENGLPDDLIIITDLFNDPVFVPTTGQTYRYNPEAETASLFYLDQNLLPQSVLPDAPLRLMSNADHGQLWLVYADQAIRVTRTPDGSVDTQVPDVLRHPVWADLGHVYVEENGVTWFGNGTELIRYDPSVDVPPVSGVAYSPLVRSISIPYTNEIVYGDPAWGAGEDGSLLRLPAESNDLRFDFAAPNYYAVRLPEYQYWLEGRDPGWSGWTTETFRIFRNLKPGAYRFHVRARTVQGPIENETLVGFRIRAPWYLSWWAYTFYFAIALAVAVFTIKYRRARTQLKELEQERQINERLNLANEQLRKANMSLQQANHMKDEFMANASHELRTPLTAILGFTAVLKEEVSREHQDFLELINENGKRLLRTLNSLLDLAKLRAGMLDVQLEKVDVAQKTAEVAELLSQLAKNENLWLEVIPPPTRIYALLDHHCYERILYNLIGNAIKFTIKGGVTVRVESRGDQVAVHVCDTGIGISPSFMPHLFDEFKQDSDSLATSREGSGLGLTITAQLVELLKGQIEVQSKKGKGSIFTISFPIHMPREEEAVVLEGVGRSYSHY